jgi:hypothetical protein
MVAAAADLLPPAFGALLQEVIDVLAILIARSSREGSHALSRTHAEIENQVSRLRRLLTGLDNDNVQTEDVVELRRLLYGLYAVLRLHNAEEEEGAFSLVPSPRRRPP